MYRNVGPEGRTKKVTTAMPFKRVACTYNVLLEALANVAQEIWRIASCEGIKGAVS